MRDFLYKTAKKKLNFGIIMTELKFPVRMCIACKARLPQFRLLRLQVHEGEISAYSGHGRSFYVCLVCADGNVKTLKKALYSKCKKIDKHILDVGKMVKEIATNG
ncbi:MAG: DUF448 domain-containing protein [Campylobacteraceae bacterium]|nr:DUF448 domain-containing protein [Campylobacteraceae bacterium]